MKNKKSTQYKELSEDQREYAPLPYRPGSSPHMYTAALDCARHDFENNPNAYTAMGLFQTCISNGVYPPENVLVWLDGKFETYLSSDKSLDASFDLTVKRSADKKNTAQKWVTFVVLVDRLSKILNLPTSKSIDRIKEHHEEYRDIDELEQLYNRHSKKARSTQEYHSFVERLTPEDVEEVRQSTLHSYPAP
jgi:hypothetical protein